MSALSQVGPEILDEGESAIRETFERIEDSYQSFGRIDSTALTALLHTLTALKAFRSDVRASAICKQIHQSVIGSATDHQTISARVLEHRDFPTLRAILETRFFDPTVWNPIKKRAGEFRWFDGYRLLSQVCPCSNFQLPLAVAWQMRDPTAVFGSRPTPTTAAQDQIPLTEAQQALDRTLDEFVVFLSESAFSPSEMNVVLRSHVQKTVNQVAIIAQP
jgi:hypothetical protein